MNILFHECKKAFLSPVLIFLLLLFTAFNLYFIFSHSYLKDELSVANEIAKNYGLNITDESLKKFEQDYLKNLNRLNEMVERYTEEKFTSVQQFLDTKSIEMYDLLSEEEWKFINKWYLEEQYLNMANILIRDYEQLNWNEIRETVARKYQLSGQAEKILENEYKQLAERFEEIKENGEHKTWFFAGNPYRMHSFLFRKLFKYIFFESLILIVLATALITNYEFENKTHLVAYSTKRGRNLAKDKFWANLIVAGSLATFLFIVTLTFYFSVFDYSHLWRSSVSSALNWEYNEPYVSWWDLNFLQYFLLSVFVICICLLIFSIITFEISLFLKNSYFTFFVVAIFFGMSILMPSFMSKSSILLFVFHFNPAVLAINPHMFFMGNSELTMFKYYEVWTLSAWSILVSFFYVYSMKKFRRQDFH